jgi:alkylation response protein AidB-like acyl-CoA dehydrogenase
VQELVGRALARRIVKNQLIDHVGSAIGDGSLPPNAGTLIRLFHAETTELEVDTALAIAGTAGVVDEGEELSDLLDSIGVRYLSRQTGSLGGGSSEMARNVISERILGFPREPAADKGVPFNQVKRGRT